MSEQDDIHAIAALLALGSANESETSWFADKKHDALLEEFRDFLERHGDLLGHGRTVNIQGLNDRGVDLLAEFPSGLVGFQLKSPYDVQQDNFAAKVKSQLADSFAHGLQKWIVLICAPMTGSGRPARVRHLLSEMSCWETNYHAVYAPEECVRYFRDATVEPMDFNLRLGRLRRATDKQDDVLAAIKALAGRTTQAADAAPSLAERVQKVEIPDRFPALLGGFDEEEHNEHNAAVRDALSSLASLPKRQRELFCTILSRADGSAGRGYGVSASEIQAALNVPTHELSGPISDLERKSLIWIDQEQGPAFIEICNAGVDWDLFSEIRRICENANVPLKSVLLDLDFSVLT